MQNIPYQMEFRPDLPANYGSKDYRDTCDLLIKIDEILITTDLEDKLVMPVIEQIASDKECPEEFLKTRRIDQQYAILRHALRCNIARHLFNDSYRKFSVKLADSQIVQWFTHVNYFSAIKGTSKSSLDRYEKLFEAKGVNGSVQSWLSTFSDSSVATSIGLSEAVDFSDFWADSTCIDANIHFPVDWVLLRDATRSLLLCIRLMRKHGLKHRMMSPDLFQKRMNKLCIEMTHTRRKVDSKKQRKKILRKMKKLSQTIQKHAERYRELFTFSWDKLGFSEAEANQVFARMDNVLTQLPEAIHQAHERIIGERQIASKDKIISLYDHDAEIIVRGKAGNEVEFGQKLLLVEQRDGLIVDWELQGKHSDTDSKILERSVQRLNLIMGLLHHSVAIVHSTPSPMISFYNQRISSMAPVQKM